MHSCNIMYLFLTSCVMVLAASAASNFNNDFVVIFGDQRAKILEGGQRLDLSMDKASGSGFKSKNQYLYGRFDMQIKMPAWNSAGTVTTFYLASTGKQGSLEHDEVDFEFLGNVVGKPFTLSTNVFAQGKGNREQQFHLWFDPSKDYHTYTIVWNAQRILFLVDNTPIRVYNNLQSLSVPFPTKQPMTLFNTFWNGEQWATEGGRVKTDWSQAPFTASYKNHSINACLGSSPAKCVPTSSDPSKVDNSWQNLGFDAASRNKLRYILAKNLIYDYCTDRKRGGPPPECRHNGFPNR